MATALTRQRSGDHAGDMLEQWRVEYGDLEERHKDLERDYWQV